MPAETPGTAVELMLALKTVAPFSSLPPDDLALLVERAKPRIFASGDVLVERGAPVGSIHLVLKGRLAEERGGQQWAIREPYEVVGGVDALSETDADVAVRAEGPARTLELDCSVLLDICHDRFEVLVTVATGVAAMAIAAQQRLGGTGARRDVVDAGTVDGEARELNLAERIVFLRSVPVLHDTPVVTLAGVAAASTQVTVDAGTTLWKVGDPSDHILLVVCGLLDCTAAEGPRSRRGPRDAAGVLDALALVPRWYQATAATRVVALRASLPDVLDVLEDDPATALAALRQLAGVTSRLIAAASQRGPNGSAPSVDVTGAD